MVVPKERQRAGNVMTWEGFRRGVESVYSHRPRVHHKPPRSRLLASYVYAISSYPSIFLHAKKYRTQGLSTHHRCPPSPVLLL